MDQGPKIKREANPKETANVFSLITFFYTLKIFTKGFKKDLEEEDLYQVIKKLNSKDLGDRLENAWDAEIAKCRKFPAIRVIWRCYAKWFIIYGMMDFLSSTVYGLIIPNATGRLVGYFSKTTEEPMTREDAYWYAAEIVVVQVVEGFFYYNYALLVGEFAAEVKTALCSLMYRKCLKLSPSALSEYSTGNIVTFMTKDVGVIESFMIYGSSVFTSLLLAAVITCILYVRIGYAALVGVAVLSIITPLQIYIGKKAGDMRLGTCKKTDQRLQTLREVLSAIKTIKVYTWEKYFMKKISIARKKEIQKLRTINCLKALTLCIGFFASNISFYLLLIVYIRHGVNVTPENIFYTIGTYSYLKYLISNSIPDSVIQIAEFLASVKRISGLLRAEELPVTFAPEKSSESVDVVPTINLHSVSAKVNGALVLKNVTCSFGQGLTLLTGPVGSGKSSLLKVILREYPINEGHLEVSGNISYASQEPWLFPATIRDNILFGEVYNEKRYKKVLEMCALTFDIELLQNGDKTIVEDRGLNLSKGQQARINLARAIYRVSDIYLLDDCLASLDTKVQDHIFMKCIQECIADKICVLVTHSDLSHFAKQVIRMENATITACDKKDFTAKDSTDDKNLKNCTKDDNEIQGILKKDITLKKTSVSFEIQPNVFRETKKQGRVDFSSYKKYISYGGSIIITIAIILLFGGQEVSFSYIQKLLSFWVNTQSNVTSYIVNNDTNSSKYEEAVELGEHQLQTYVIFMFIAYSVLLTKAISFYFYISRISVRIHNSVVEKVINASMEFYDRIFIGNILNRFSRDLTIIDEDLPFSVASFLSLICGAFGVLGLVTSVNLWYIIPSSMVAIILLTIRYFYIPTGRSLKRLDCATRSPVVGHINSTLEGLTTIRAYNQRETLKEEFDKRQDLFTSAYHLSLITEKGFGIGLNVISILYITAILTHLIIMDDSLPGDAGLALSQAFSLSWVLLYLVRRWALLENEMTSVERFLEFSDVEQEPVTGSQPLDWPTKASIEFKNVSLRYKKSKQEVLKNVSFSANSQEKVGIIGRTGAGKSSIISALFRLYKTEGKITIDGVDIETVAISSLRPIMTIIPQDPIMFKDTIRNNLDPYNKNTDEQIWKSLESVYLKGKIRSLQEEVTDADVQFSVGQRQLLCLARALIRKNKIIIMDEATANLDNEMTTLINKIVREQFTNCTILTIAHKNESLKDSDKIVQLDKGEVVICDHPSELLQNKKHSSHYREDADIS